MDSNTKEIKYLEKIKNDVNEHLYDLLIIHLMNFLDKVNRNGPNKDKLIQLLDLAIYNLREHINNYTKSSYYRHIILLCNIILRYKPHRKDLKNLKRELIEEFTHSEHDSGEKIPLNYQMNEIRITYDADYLAYLTRHFIKLKDWNKALYCLIAVRLIEPDNEFLDDYYKEIKENVDKEEIEEKNFERTGNWKKEEIKKHLNLLPVNINKGNIK